MRKYLLPFLAILCACTEKVDLQSRSDYHDYLAVEATLTDRPEDAQRIVLSRSISYFHNESQPMVQGASVKVNDVVFTEKEPGIYEAPEGYACETDVEYRLRIQLPDGGNYEAEATMPEPGFRMDAVDYAFAGGKTMDSDSLWTVAVWGYEKDIDSNYLLTHAVNGLYQPFQLALVSDDKFFNHNDVQGFPITALMQSEVLRKQYKQITAGYILNAIAETEKILAGRATTAAVLSGLEKVVLAKPEDKNKPQKTVKSRIKNKLKTIFPVRRGKTL